MSAGQNATCQYHQGSSRKGPSSLWVWPGLTLLEVVRPVRERHEGEILPLLGEQVTVMTLIWHQWRVGKLHLVVEENKVEVGQDGCCCGAVLFYFTALKVAA